MHGNAISIARGGVREFVDERIGIMEGRFVEIFDGKAVFMMFCDSSCDFEMLHSYCAGLCLVYIIPDGDQIEYVCIALPGIGVIVRIVDSVSPFVGFLKKLDAECDVVGCQDDVVEILGNKYGINFNQIQFDIFMGNLSTRDLRDHLERMEKRIENEYTCEILRENLPC